MKQTPEFINSVTREGYPSGGTAMGEGLAIRWQEGMMPIGADGQLMPNGAFIETVIETARQRLEFFQTEMDGRFACDENAKAIEKLESALRWLDYRTAGRAARQVDNTYEV